MSKRKLHVEKETLDFIADALEILELDSPSIQTVKCPNCGYPINFPLIARESDVKRMQELINLAAEYLNEKGLLDKMLKDVLEKIKARLKVQ